MKPDLEQLHEATRKLRADLAATNMALQCLLTVLSPDQQKQALAALAQLSVAREDFAAQIPSKAVQEAQQQIQQAVERLYQALQGAHRSRMSKLSEG